MFKCVYVFVCRLRYVCTCILVVVYMCVLCMCICLSIVCGTVWGVGLLRNKPLTICSRTEWQLSTAFLCIRPLAIRQAGCWRYESGPLMILIIIIILRYVILPPLPTSFAERYILKSLFLKEPLKLKPGSYSSISFDTRECH